MWGSPWSRSARLRSRACADATNEPAELRHGKDRAARCAQMVETGHVCDRPAGARSVEACWWDDRAVAWTARKTMPKRRGSIVGGLAAGMVAALVLLPPPAARAIVGGALDGNGHPSVGAMLVAES